MNTKLNLFLSVFAVMLLFLAGCSKQSYVSVSDPRGIEEGAPVIWYEGDAYVGKVSKVKEADGHFQIFIDFQKSYEKSIHAGVKACPLVEPKISNQPILLLVGGKDTTMPILEPGSMIPEISLDELQRMKRPNFWEWFGRAKMGITLFFAALILIMFFLCLLKVVAKLVKCGLFVAIIVIVAFYLFNLSGDWKQYQETASKYVQELKIEEIRDWLQKRYAGIKENLPGIMQNLKIQDEQNGDDANFSESSPATPQPTEESPQSEEQVQSPE